MSGKGKQRGADIKQEDILQAVVIADTFNVRFAPITEKKPRVKFKFVLQLPFTCSQHDATFFFAHHLL